MCPDHPTSGSPPRGLLAPSCGWPVVFAADATLPICNGEIVLMDIRPIAPLSTLAHREALSIFDDFAAKEALAGIATMANCQASVVFLALDQRVLSFLRYSLVARVAVLPP